MAIYEPVTTDQSDRLQLRINLIKEIDQLETGLIHNVDFHGVEQIQKTMKSFRERINDLLLKAHL